MTISLWMAIYHRKPYSTMEYWILRTTQDRNKQEWFGVTSVPAQNLMCFEEFTIVTSVAVEYINLTQLSHHISHLSQLDEPRTGSKRGSHAYKTYTLMIESKGFNPFWLVVDVVLYPTCAHRKCDLYTLPLRTEWLSSVITLSHLKQVLWPRAIWTGPP